MGGNSYDGVALLGQADALGARCEGYVNGDLTVSEVLRKFSIHQREVSAKAYCWERGSWWWQREGKGGRG